MRANLFWKIPVLALLFLLSPIPLWAQGNPGDEAEALLAGPAPDLPRARQALVLLEGQLPAAGPGRERLLTRLARGFFILGDLAPAATRREFYEKGRAVAELLLQEDPQGVAGHYWLALNLAGLADAGGAFTGRRLLPRILKELKQALARDEAYDQAGAHRTLGRIHFQAPAPPFSVGDLKKSETHLTAAARLAPECSTNHLYLAETLLRLHPDNPTPARRELEQVLTSPRHAWHTPGLGEDRREARRLLAELGEK